MSRRGESGATKASRLAWYKTYKSTWEDIDLAPMNVDLDVVIDPLKTLDLLPDVDNDHLQGGVRKELRDMDKSRF
jgi:hypothetical protein